MHRFSLLIAAALVVGAFAHVACNATVTEGCVQGPCGQDAGIAKCQGDEDCDAPAKCDVASGACVVGCVSDDECEAVEAGQTCVGGICTCDIPTFDLGDACDPSAQDQTGDIPCDVFAVMHRDPIESGGCHNCHNHGGTKRCTGGANDGMTCTSDGDCPGATCLGGTENGAPFPELTYEELLQLSVYAGVGDPPNPNEVVYQSMLRALQPEERVPSGYTHMPFSTAPQLTCQEILTITNWLAQCAPPDPEGMGEGSCCAELGYPSDPDRGCP